MTKNDEKRDESDEDVLLSFSQDLNELERLVKSLYKEGWITKDIRNNYIRHIRSMQKKFKPSILSATFLLAAGILLGVFLLILGLFTVV